MFDFYKNGDITEEEADKEYDLCINSIENLELKNMLGNEEDSLDAVITINSGAGGTESNDWAEMLERMYNRWAEDNN
jgi:peptide chain release factor 2